MKPFLADADVTIFHGDALNVLREMSDGSVDCCVTSPPYLDARPEYPSPSPAQFGLIFADLRRVVTGPLCLNVGRLWRGGMEVLWWTVLLDAARLHGWCVLDTLIWAKPNGNPIQGLVFTNSHEYVFVLGSAGIELNADAIRTPYASETLSRYSRKFAANSGVKGHDRPAHRRSRSGVADEAGARPRSYVEFPTGRDKGNPHPAPMARELAEHLVKLASWPGQTVLDPFAGSGTTLAAARKLGRVSIGIELLEENCDLAAQRLGQQSLLAELL